MYKIYIKIKIKYKQPIQIFLIFEKINSLIWNSKNLNHNHSIVTIQTNIIYAINLFIRNELFLSNNMIVESSAIDLSNYKNVKLYHNNLTKILLNNHFIIFYNYYNFNLKSKLTILFLINKIKYNINSIDNIFNNCNWLERELSEMYGIKFKWKNDTRKLLLDYIKIESPLLKDYQCEGYQDVFYNTINNQVMVIKGEVVEL